MSPRTLTQALGRTGTRHRTIGVSLIEALLALVVMSLGMLAVVGVQATLRANGDLSRQRAEAVRLAQEALEEWRIFTSVTAVAGARDYTDIISIPATDITPAGANATYTLTREVAPVPASGSPPLRTFAVTVEWVDRSGETQRVQLFSSIARVPPAIAASLSVPPNGGPALRPLGRHVAIPRGAVMGTGGTSTFTPPQPTGSTNITTLEFNNLSGEITCIRVGGGPCSTDRAQLLSGIVTGPWVILPFGMRIDYRSAAGPVNSPVPTGSPPRNAAYDGSELCFLDVPVGNRVDYYCVVRLAPASDGSTPPWSGEVVFFQSATPTTAERACRFGANPNPIPYPYSNVTVPLSNQNFEVLPTGSTFCNPGTVPMF